MRFICHLFKPDLQDVDIEMYRKQNKSNFSLHTNL